MERARSAVTMLLAVVSASVTLIFAAQPAAAHAELTSSSPREGARLAAAPSSLSIRFSEPPTVDAVLSVTDGCGDEVVDAVEVLNLQLDGDLSAGQPGVWEASFGVVSAVDGHPTRGRFSFRVSGPADCSGTGSDDPDIATGDAATWTPPYMLWGGIALALIAPAAIVRILVSRTRAAS